MNWYIIFFTLIFIIIIGVILVIKWSKEGSKKLEERKRIEESKKTEQENLDEKEEEENNTWILLEKINPYVNIKGKCFEYPRYLDDQIVFDYIHEEWECIGDNYDPTSTMENGWRETIFKDGTLVNYIISRSPFSKTHEDTRIHQLDPNTLREIRYITDNEISKIGKQDKQNSNWDDDYYEEDDDENKTSDHIIVNNLGRIFEFDYANEFVKKNLTGY